MNILVVCEQCREQGLTSTVVTEGAKVCTAVYCAPFWDHEGQRHDHDRNVGTTAMRCSHGHRFTRTTVGSCWCGWKGTP